MRKASTRSFTVVCLVLAAAGSNAQTCNPNPFRPSMLPPCNTIGSKIADAVGATVQLKGEIAALNERIYQARQRFWAVYPDGPGYAEAEIEYLSALREKNFNLLSMYLVSGMTGPAVKMINTLDFGPGVTVDQYRRRLRGDINQIDGGLNPTARPLFVQWVNSLRREAGATKDGDLVINPIFFGNALAHPTSRRQAYERAQLWAEILASGIDLKKYFSSELYVQLMMETRVSIQLGAAETPDIPNCQAATVALYQTFVRLMGEKAVAHAAVVVFAAPKSAWGDLATSTDVDIGNHQTATYDPYLRFLDLLTGSSPRNYAIALLLDQYQLNSNYSIKEKWVAAAAEYDQQVKKYGEPAVLTAAAKVKAARKSANGGIRGDPQYRPVNAWFQLALSEPKTVVPDGNLPHFKASSYTRRWVGKQLAVRGTVSRVDVDSGGQPVYATIFFKESARHEIVAFTPYAKWLQGEYGNDFTGLVGAPVEIYGEVQDWREGAGVRVLDVRQIVVVKPGFAGPDETDSKPDWLNEPERKLVENPQYAAWKKFPPGTAVTYVDRNFFEPQSGTDLYQRSDIGRTILRLESIDATRAVVIVSATVNNNGVPTSAAERSLVYKATVPPEITARPPPAEFGDETLVISGKKYATHWEKVLMPVRGKPDPNSYTKTWFSDDVPGRQVLVRQQAYDEILGKIHRRYNTTMIEPVAGIEPELGELQPDATKSVLIVSSRGLDEIQKSYLDLGARATAMKERLGDWQRARRGIRPPVKIEDAITYGDFEIRKIWPAIMAKNAAAAETAMRAAEEKLNMVEQFLKTGEEPPTPKGSGSNKTALPNLTPPPPVQTSAQPPPTQIVQPTPRPRVDMPALPPEMAGLVEISRQYSSVMGRISQVKVGLMQWQQKQGGSDSALPREVREARDRLDSQMQALGRAMGTRDPAQFGQERKSTEETLATIERFLKQ